METQEDMLQAERAEAIYNRATGSNIGVEYIRRDLSYYDAVVKMMETLVVTLSQPPCKELCASRLPHAQ